MHKSVPKDYSDPNSFAKDDEHSQQVALMAACAQYAWNGPEQCKPLLWLHAIPNGGSRGESARSAQIEGARMKAEGVKKGVADLMLPCARHGYHGFYIEMKKPAVRNGGRAGLSKEQQEFEKWVMREGYLFGVFNSWGSAFRALMWYLGFEHTRNWVLPE